MFKTIDMRSRHLFLATVCSFFMIAYAAATPANDTTYSIRICVDVPDNNRPGKVFFKGEPGHVFVVLERMDTAAFFRECYVWGFYPKKAISCILFRKVKSRLVDNSNKEYDVSVTRLLNKTEYRLLMQKALELSHKKYHLNSYNCYHYALELFNSLNANPALPVSCVRFPFLFGKGGSPCCLYRDLQNILSHHPSNTLDIQFNRSNAPRSGSDDKPAAKSN